MPRIVDCVNLLLQEIVRYGNLPTEGRNATMNNIYSSTFSNMYQTLTEQNERVETIFPENEKIT